MRTGPSRCATWVSKGVSCAVAGLLATGLVRAAAAQIVPQERFDREKADVRVLLDRTAYEPGAEARVAVVLTIEDGWHTNSHVPTYDGLIGTAVRLDTPPRWPEATEPVYPPGEMQTFSFAEDAISVYDGEVVIRSDVPVPVEIEPGTYPIRATVTYQACDDRICLAPVEVEETLGLTVGPDGAEIEEYTAIFAAGAAVRHAAGRQSEASSGAPRGFAWFLLLGFVGGLILNAMPCVLPVLSLKVIGLVKSVGAGRGAVVSGSLATSLGIVLSFLLLAAAAVGARAAGVAVGWGIQFQEPAFVAALTVVVLLFTLNLWGLFEIPLPASLSRVASSGPDEGLGGHLATGFFATLMATPCSAPFLGTALGFALTQSAVTTFAVFSAIGFGMASPYLLLAAVPAAGRLLPRPGAWMDAFRKAMGFLLAATAVWLLYVLSALVSAERLAFFELGLLGVAAALWAGHRRRARGGGGRLAAVTAVVLALGCVAYAAAGGAAGSAGRTAGVAPEDRLIDWEPFDLARAEAEAAAGRYVFVDVTADWCFTCKVNERLFLETEEVAGAFERHDVLALRADWTRRDDAISAYLASFDRYGIPFYVLYRPDDEPYVFSELLSKSAILELLE